MKDQNNRMLLQHQTNLNIDVFNKEAVQLQQMFHKLVRSLVNTNAQPWHSWSSA